MNNRSVLFNLIGGLLNINTENGRFENIPTEEIIFPSIENECYFVLICPCYRDHRTKYFKEYYFT